MSGFVAPLCQGATHRQHVLLDTEDRYDAWNTGRDAPENYRDGMGLLIVYDGTGTIPSVTLNGPDGQIEFTGARKSRRSTPPCATPPGSPKPSARRSRWRNGAVAMTERLHLKPTDQDIGEPVDFFMVWTKTGWRPRKAHESFDAASAEAQRLARNHPGKKFIVLKAVAKYHVPQKLTPPVAEPA